MRYTVIGVWDHQGDDDTELIIAGVVAGDLPLVDTGDAWYDATINTDTPHPPDMNRQVSCRPSYVGGVVDESPVALRG